MKTVQRDGHLEELLFHEATHAGLDNTIVRSDAWQAAVAADPAFISDYAAKNPEREDVAESLLAWFAARHRPSRITPLVRQTIESTIPGRLAVFDTYDFDLAPFPR